jgi:hypothetical protein
MRDKQGSAGRSLPMRAEVATIECGCAGEASHRCLEAQDQAVGFPTEAIDQHVPATGRDAWQELQQDRGDAAAASGGASRRLTPSVIARHWW